MRGRSQRRLSQRPDGDYFSEWSVAGNVHTGTRRAQSRSLSLIDVSGEVDDVVFAQPGAKLDCVGSHAVCSQAFFQEPGSCWRWCTAPVAVGTDAHFGFLNAASERAAWTKCKLDGVGHTVVPGDLEVQLKYALLFRDRHLLVQHLEVRNRPVRKVQLAPESAVFCRC